MQPPENVTISPIRRRTKQIRSCGVNMQAISPVWVACCVVAFTTKQPKPRRRACTWERWKARAEPLRFRGLSDVIKFIVSWTRGSITALRQHYCDEFLIETGCHHLMIRPCSSHDMMNSKAILNGADKRVSFAVTAGRSWHSRCLSPASGLSGERSTHISQHAAQMQMWRTAGRRTLTVICRRPKLPAGKRLAADRGRRLR